MLRAKNKESNSFDSLHHFLQFKTGISSKKGHK